MNDKLVHNFHKAARMMGRGMFFYTQGQEPMHHGQGRLLTLIREMQPVSQKDLVEKLDIRPSSLSEMLKKLEQKGLVERKQDEQDKRNMVVSLTEEGSKKLENRSEKGKELSEKLFEGLDGEEQEQLNALLEKLIASWQEAFGGQEMHGPEARFGPHGRCHGEGFPHPPHHMRHRRMPGFGWME